MERRWLIFVCLLMVFAGAIVLFAQMRDMRSKEVKSAANLLMKEKQKLIEEGKYDCCLRHPCDQCLLSIGICPCGENASKGKPVCHECKGGWYAGDGAIPGKTANEIKTMPRR